MHSSKLSETPLRGRLMVLLGALASATATQAALVSYLSLDDSSGITLNNGAAITSGSQGKFGEAASFDGTDDWAAVTAGNPVTGGAQRTISVWVRQDSDVNTGAFSGLRTPVAFGTNGNGTKWDFDIDNTNGAIEVGVGGGRTVGSGLTGLTGNWMLMVSTLPVTNGNVGNTLTYLNGTVTNAGTGTRAIATGATDPLASFRLGAGANNNTGPTPPSNTIPSIQFFDGLVDDVAVWNEALSGDEIKGLYDVGSTIALSYSANLFDQLKQVHDAATGSTTIGGLNWSYATGLGGPAGLSGSGSSFTLVLDGGTGTGLVSSAIPEPTIALLGGLGLLGLLRRRR